MDIIIENFTTNGKLLGGCCYAGFPIDANYRIKFGPHLYMELNACMIITESLDYQVILDWGAAPEWTKYEYRFSIEEFDEHICEPSFLGIEQTEDIMTDDPILQVNRLNITITIDNREQIDEFINDFRSRMKALSMEMKSYYHTHEDLIKGRR